MNRTIKVIHAIPELKVGGVERVAMHLLQSPLHGVEYHLLVIEQADIDLIEKLPAHVLTRLHILNGKKHRPSTYFKAIHRIKEIAPDWLMASLWRAQPLIWMSRQENYKTVTCFHNTRFSHILDKAATIFSLKNANYCFTDSQATAEFIRQFSNIRIEHLHHIIQQPLLTGVRKQKRLVYIGRLATQKGLEQGIQLIVALKRLRQTWHLDCYGPDEGALRKLQLMAKQYGVEEQIHFFGSRNPSEISTILASYDYLLQPSPNEGMAMVVMEAMQQGTIPVVRPSGEIPQYTQDDHDAIWFNAVNDQLAKRLIALADNDQLREQMRTRMKEKASNWKDVCDELSTLLLSLHVPANLSQNY
ncbi:glycosyltransferase family 4 protein [Pokkaliibacter plantistimulans]|nr:glycosyltransferase family 4 protein [Pokkaliibacter plantistimulans]